MNFSVQAFHRTKKAEGQSWLSATDSVIFATIKYISNNIDANTKKKEERKTEEKTMLKSENSIYPERKKIR